MFRYSLFIILVVMCAGCGVLRFPSINAPKPPDQIYQYSQTIDKQPKVVQVGDGKSVVWESQKQTVDVNYARKETPLNWWQRFCNWLGNLGFLSLLAIGIGLFVAPAGTIAWLWKVKDKFKKAFKQTVAAIDEANALEKSPELKAALSAKQDSDVKALVDDVQQPGK